MSGSSLFSLEDYVTFFVVTYTLSLACTWITAVEAAVTASISYVIRGCVSIFSFSPMFLGCLGVPSNLWHLECFQG
jgi:hypothetical protein